MTIGTRWDKSLLDRTLDMLKNSIVPFIRFIPLGSWDMDADANLSFTMGSDKFKDMSGNAYKRIMFCCVLIIADDGTRSIQMPQISFTWDSSSFVITRGSGYDSTDYNDITINRGYLFLILHI